MAKTGSQALEEAKKKINDPNYNVFSGNVEKNKNKQTDENKRRIKTSDVINAGSMLVGGPALGLGAKAISKLAPKIKNLFRGTSKTKPKVSTSNTKLSKTTKTTKTNKNNKKNKVTPTTVTKPKQGPKPKTSTRIKNFVRKNKVPIIAGTTALGTGTALLSGSKSNKDNKKVELPKKRPDINKKKTPDYSPRKGMPKKSAPVKDYTGKFVNKKGEVAYDSVGDFFRNITGTAKKRARRENRKRIQSATKGATKGIGFSGKSVGNPFKFNSGGPLKSVPEGNKGLGKLPTPVRNKMGYMKKGGIVKMRGGGAATRGMNFNRGR